MSGCLASSEPSAAMLSQRCRPTHEEPLATPQSAPPRRLNVLARGVEVRSNFGRELQLARVIGDVSGRGEADDQPPPGRSVEGVEHLSWLSSNYPTQADELLGRGSGRSLKETTFTRCRRDLPLGHTFRGYQPTASNRSHLAASDHKTSPRDDAGFGELLVQVCP
jgi:hypothetical protein